MMNLVVAGLTGSGKTSATQEVAQRLGLRWISGSDLRRWRLRPEQGDAAPSRLQDAISAKNLAAEQARLLAGPGEAAFDTELLQLARSVRSAVFDVWYLPWLLTKGTAVTVFLEADFETRTPRVAHNVGDSCQPIAQIVHDKDERARQYGLKQYGIDIFEDRTPFDAILRTDSLPVALVAKYLCILLDAGSGSSLSRSEAALFSVAAQRWPPGKGSIA